MKDICRSLVTLLLTLTFLSNALPCGPGYITPVFEVTSAPEPPYTDFAAGRLGIIKPGMPRSVLFAAYRHIAGGGLSAAEQEALIQVWRADLNNKDFNDNSVDEAVKTWVARRKEVAGSEEKTPDIYAERAYGGYDFFPNCTSNAFETAAETLADRVSAHGPGDPGVKDWLTAQDQVFQNCASGKQTPNDAPPGAPDWLQKDRAYQMAAAAFYALDYPDAKRRFAEIAQDNESPWQETADYLVARTLIRQASLSKGAERSGPLYDEAEIHLERFTSRTGKFTNSAERMMGLIRYRRHPRERVSELAKKLSFSGGNENFRQDLIDYNWLLDKFENEVLSEAEKRKQAAAANSNAAAQKTAPTPDPVEPDGGDMIEFTLYSADYSENWKVRVKSDATDAEAIAETERVRGQALTAEQKAQVRELRQSAYAGRFANGRQPSYEGGYYGEEKLTPSLMPDFLRQDDLTDWLFTYQTPGPEAYLYSLRRFKETGAEHWLMAAVSKADASSAELPRLFEAASSTSRLSVAYPTIALGISRILLAQGKTVEARKLLDEMIASGDALPLSARNAFIGLRLKLAETLEDYLLYSLRKPYGFDFSGDVGSIDAMIAEQKSWYDPEYNKEGREAYDAEVESRYKEERKWQDRTMFDGDIIDVFNQHFPTASLIDVQRSPALPDYMRSRFAVAVWTRAFLLDNMATLLAITPEVIKYYPDLEPQLAKVTAAKTQPAMDTAALFFVLKNPIFSPYLEEGMGKTNNEQEDWSTDDWWCEPYDTEYNDATSSEQQQALPPRPPFLTAVQSKIAQAERKRLKETGDAPKFLGEKVLAWAKRAPADRRVPEALYIMVLANGWNKYGCGNNEDVRNALAAHLKRHYPGSEWTAKLVAEESAQ